MHFLPLFIAVPLLAAFIIPLFSRLNKRLPDILGSITTFYLLIAAAGIYFIRPYSNVLVYKMGGWAPPFGINLVLDGFSHLLLLTISLIAFLATIYSISYMNKYTAKGKYYTLFLLMLAGMNGVVLTGDLFNLYVFLEIAAVASYALVAFGTEAEELEASFKYLIMGAVASAFILLGIAIIYGLTGTLNMADAARTLSGSSHAAVMFVAALFAMGFGMKAALIPFHAWLPDAHPSAPAPISAMLSGVLIKALGVYAIIRIFYNVLGMTPQLSSILLVLSGIAILVGGLLALGQEDFKRLLAYSSISQVGYIILGVALGTPLGILAGLFHLFNHAVFKGLLFLNAGAVEYSTGTRELSKMGGLSQKMPATSLTTLVGSLAISGIPPFSGFWSKVMVILACVQVGRLGYAAVAIVGSILTLAALLKVQKSAFFGKISGLAQTAKEVPGTMLASMIVLALICLVIGLVFPIFTRFVIDPAVIAVASGLGYSRLVLGGL
jgi:multicomponent Na+:H+ antiporter subunit D